MKNDVCTMKMANRLLIFDELVSLYDTGIDPKLNWKEKAQLKYRGKWKNGRTNFLMN
jgi:hypothetical protein